MMFYSLIFFIIFMFFQEFLFLLSLFKLIYMVSSSWNGSMFMVDGSMSFFLIYLSLLIFMMVLFIELNLSIRLLSMWVLMLCIIFFMVNSFIHMYMILESSILPFLFLLLGYGYQVEKIQASYYLVFYSTFSTMPLLFIVVEDSVLNSSLPFMEWTYLPYVSLVMMSMGFFMKLPLFLFHMWLPKVHVESPTSSSMLLASLMLKMGGYGLMRLLPSYSWMFCGFIMSLTLFSMIFCSILCIFLSDLKSFVAYSSIVHMGFFLMTLLQDSMLSKSASLFLMVSHGMLSSVMFYFAGELFYIFNTRMIYFIKGLRASSLVFSQFFMLSLLANSSIPIFLGFYGEVLSLSVMFSVSPWLMIFLIIYFMISLYYNLWLMCAALSGNFMSFISPLCLQMVLPLLFLNIFFIILI